MNTVKIEKFHKFFIVTDVYYDRFAIIHKSEKDNFDRIMFGRKNTTIYDLPVFTRLLPKSMLERNIFELINNNARRFV